MATATDLLKEDKDFFEEYKEKFAKKFKEKLIELELLKRVEGNLDFILQTFYEVILKPSDKRKLELVKKFIEKFHQWDIPIREILVQIFLEFLEDYIAYLKGKACTGLEIKKVKQLAEHLDSFINLIDSVFSEYLEQLKLKKFQKVVFEPKEAGEILKLIKESGTPHLNTLAVYKNFPVPCKVPLFSVTDLVLKTKKCPYKVFAPNETVFVMVPKTNRWALAEITNVQQEYMYLKPLRYAKDFKPPKGVRVFPEKEIAVRIETPEGNIFGYMDYVSFEELGVITSSAGNLKEDTRVKVSFKLPLGEVKVSATVKGVKKLNGTYLVELELEPDHRAEQLISRYVLKRQQEIMKELKI